MTDITLRISVLLSLQGALLGEINSKIRGITCGWDLRIITMNCFFDGDIDDDDRESMECVATEVMADFYDHEVSVECIRLDVPKPLNPHTLLAWVYRRKE